MVDKEVESGFHFIIEEYRKSSSGSFQLLMTRKPRSQSDIEKYQNWLDIPALASSFDAWLALLDEYDNINSFFDDPILNAFENEFFADFEIVDDDADSNPFNTKQILLLDNYLEVLEVRLNEYITPVNANEIEDIQSDISNLRDDLTFNSKKKIVQKIAKIWTKIAKQGTKFIKEFLSESGKEMTKQIVKGLVEIIKETGAELLS